MEISSEEARHSVQFLKWDKPCFSLLLVKCILAVMLMPAYGLPALFLAYRSRELYQQGAMERSQRALTLSLNVTRMVIILSVVSLALSYGLVTTGIIQQSVVLAQKTELQLILTTTLVLLAAIYGLTWHAVSNPDDSPKSLVFVLKTTGIILGILVAMYRLVTIIDAFYNNDSHKSRNLQTTTEYFIGLLVGINALTITHTSDNSVLPPVSTGTVLPNVADHDDIHKLLTATLPSVSDAGLAQDICIMLQMLDSESAGRSHTASELGLGNPNTADGAVQVPTDNPAGGDVDTDLRPDD